MATLHEGLNSLKIGLGISYNSPKGSKYENPSFFDELENEVLEFKYIYGEDGRF
jgi:hypothetical protein